MSSRKTSQTPCRAIICLSISCCIAASLPAAEIYVNNRLGSDANNGSSAIAVSESAGPVRTIRRAAQLATFGDTVVLANNGIVYHESVQLVGSRHSGSAQDPFVLRGNGAVISGARLVPPWAWRKHQKGLWQLKPWHKGHYQLFLDDKRVAEHACEAGAVELPAIPINHWCAWRGSIYLRKPEVEDPSQRNYTIAGLGVGLTLYRVHDVRIENVTFRHFRLDGINAHDLCRRVVFENVTASENGRAGLAVGGASNVLLRKSTLTDNRKDSLLISELGFAEVVDSNLSHPPTVGGKPEPE